MEDQHNPKIRRVLRASYLKRVFSEDEETVSIESTKVERKHRRKRSSADSGCGSTTNNNARLEEHETKRVASLPNGLADSIPVGLESAVAKRERNGEIPVRTRRSVPKYVEITCLGFVLLAIAALFTIPIIFYHLEQVSIMYVYICTCT